MAENTAKKQPASHLKDFAWKPGQSGNPAGKPKGARHKLQEDFVKALADDFEKEGVTAIQEMRQNDPSGYVRTVASLLPKQVEINETLDVIGDAELIDVISALRSAIASATPGSGTRQAGKRKQAQELPSVH